MPPAKIEQKRWACTVVSLLPYLPPKEQKPHIIPSVFQIPAADPEYGFGLLYVGEGLHFIPNVFDEKNNHRVITSPAEMARSIVEDFVSGQLGLEEGAAPGLFWLEGQYTEKEIIRDFAEELAEAKQKQTRWFKNLVFMADADWVRSKNILAVSDLQRHAAKALGVTKEWVDMKAVETAKCKWCSTAVQPDTIKCPNCHEVVNEVLYKEMKIAQNKLIGEPFDPMAAITGAK